MLDTKPLVRIEGLRVEFQTHDGPVTGVEDLSFDIRPGECLCVVGESGSGKSVSSLSLMRLVEFGGGEIANGRLLFQRERDEIDLAKAPPAAMRDIRGNEIAMIFQEPMTALNPVFTVGEQLAEGLIVHRGLTRAQARARAPELLHEVRIPEPERRLRQYPHELSGGMRQRVVIAMAMACRPRLLICDEPTTALDVTIQAEILTLIDRLKRETGMAVLFITHDMAVVAQMADRVVVMFRGNKVEEGPVGQIFEAPREPYTQALLAAVPRLGEMTGRDAPEPMRLMREGQVARPEPVIPPAPAPLLVVRNLCTRFAVKGGILRRTVAQVHAVEDVSFTVNAGETLSLVGESGCGKSTTGRSILRLVEPSSGQVSLGGRDILALGASDLRKARRDMQMIFQDPFASLDPQMRLLDQIEEPMLNYGIGNRVERRDRIARLFDRVELPRGFMKRYPHELSGGQRQRIAIARALALNPKLIIADEAVSALDVSVQAQVLNLLMELQRDLGISMLFISHDMAVVERVSHHVGVMYLGRIVEIGTRRQVFENPQHGYTRQLMAAVPVADPRRRKIGEDLRFRPIPSPIHPVGHVPAPSVYREVAPGHLVLAEPATHG
ncbi:ABC transporter ATP-binding protein [Paracoccus denitrificans]|jgi:peptide/nickel transport system ATP-binding protein/glutathione transport system ATP-binding protein|uniref:Glutathione import ATP-binding protein GsiA n=1 Tax=Paracoccus denitrificans (strain Pd 1222) TaxID=318586 RepID=A1AZM7_PARDP|nr:ABC transporter ATP-binding protein [Paracoccus denitrificans]ABL68721.1 ABC transporter related protein [Paracoccus denitrificans PD1222]MBB4625553.1 peptide/nickel transport system ATP-binding protein/glutathione transport system ATP-binding protein [Paracoccus denitrificans]MCU7427278.1 ABC transporter ATP-binding protein [Paracoccus denitrificans]QAR26776.1 ABC transporter ATP-binding protein [Paracoccus denitrificans]UPV95728.1 ABC transporter ATP-binding protein [Paracoccus denitrific